MKKKLRIFDFVLTQGKLGLAGILLLGAFGDVSSFAMHDKQGEEPGAHKKAAGPGKKAEIKKEQGKVDEIINAQIPPKAPEIAQPPKALDAMPPINPLQPANILEMLNHEGEVPNKEIKKEEVPNKEIKKEEKSPIAQQIAEPKAPAKDSGIEKSLALLERSSAFKAPAKDSGIEKSLALLERKAPENLTKTSKASIEETLMPTASTEMKQIIDLETRISELLSHLDKIKQEKSELEKNYTGLTKLVDEQFLTIEVKNKELNNYEMIIDKVNKALEDKLEEETTLIMQISSYRDEFSSYSQKYGKERDKLVEELNMLKEKLATAEKSKSFYKPASDPEQHKAEIQKFTSAIQELRSENGSLKSEGDFLRGLLRDPRMKPYFLSQMGINTDEL